MLQFLTWASAALALLVAGWLASAWHHQRKINLLLLLLLLQLKVTRQTAAAHADQARRQVGQLQADLVARPPAPRAAAPRDEPLAEGIRRRPVAPDRYVVLEDGFPQTAVIGDGFAATELMR